MNPTQKQEFNLSEQRMFGQEYTDYKNNGYFYLEEDVKKFIRLLKEELCGFDKVGELAHKEIFESIDKLAGEKLI